MRRMVKFNVNGQNSAGIVLADQVGQFGGTLAVKNGDGFFVVAESYTSGHPNGGYPIDKKTACALISAIDRGDTDEVFDLKERAMCF